MPIRASVLGGEVRIRFNGEALREFTALPDLPHLGVRRFQVTSISVGIEQRICESIAVESLPKGAEQRGIARKSQCQALVFFEVTGHEFRKVDCGK